MGVADDVGLVRLAENLRQRHQRDPPAANEVAEHIPRPHRGQLVRIPDHHQPAPGPQSRQQRLHQRQVHHAHLVHQHGLRLQGVALPLFVGHLARQVVIAHAETPVDGLGLPLAQLPHPLGRPARGGQQQNLQPHFFKQPHNGSRGRSLARAGSAGEQQNTRLGRQHHRFSLQRRVVDALGPLHFLEDPVHAPHLSVGEAQHGEQLLRHKALRLVQLRGVAPQNICYLLLADGSLLHHGIQAHLHPVRRQTDQLRRRPQEFFPG